MNTNTFNKDTGDTLVLDYESVNENNHHDSLIEVKDENGFYKQYADVNDFKNDITSGIVRKEFQVRVNQGEENGQPAEWCHVEQAARQDPDLEKLYRPVWSYIKKGLRIGLLLGIIFKALDTSILFFAADPAFGLLWLVFAAALYYRWWTSFLVLFGFYLITGTWVWDLYFVGIGVAVTGALFGIPAGVLVGSIVGYIKKRKLARAYDAEPEGAKPFVVGVVLPAIFLAILVPLYLFWLNPLLVETLGH